MALINWDSSISIDIQEIDIQHKMLIRLMNKLHDAMKNNTGKQIISDIILQLHNYTIYHFSTEEKYFDEYSYPESVKHKIEHEYFINQIEEFQKDLKNGKAMISLSVMQFLKRWLITHIKKSDRDYAPFFINKGLK